MEISQLEKFNFTYPGHWVSGSDREWAFEIANILSLMEREFICAVASYSMFEPITINNVNCTIDQSKYSRSLNSIYAREFVYSLDSISKILKVLNSQIGLPGAVHKLISEYDINFENLKHIRDSAAHIEDRGRALGKDRKKISSTIIILGCFNERRFEFTASNGKCCGVDISESTLLLAHRILQAIINAFTWD
jgi:hypothetical protein